LNKQDVFLKHNRSKQDELSFDLNSTNNDQEKSLSNIEQDSLFDNDQNQKKNFKRKRKQK
jgi:hypothetical protein